MKNGMKRSTLVALQVLVGVAFLVVWHLLTTVPMANGKPLFAPFFFSTPLDVLARTWKDITGGTLWHHLGITMLETVLAFGIGAGAGIVVGFAFARRELLAAVFDPDVEAANARPPMHCRAWCWRRSSHCGSAWASGRRWRSASRWFSSSSSSTSTRA
jgi:NitT/TauT family transport system permease protein